MNPVVLVIPLVLAVGVAAAAVATPTPVGQQFNFDWTISLGNVMTLVVVGGGFFTWFISNINARRDLVRDVKEVQDKIDDLKDVVVKMAQYDIRFTNMESTIVRLQNQVDELRHGEGMVLPVGRYVPPRKPGD